MQSQTSGSSEARDRAAIEADEIAFFSHHYGNQAYNQTGWRLRLERECRSLLRAAGTRRLGRLLSIGCGAGEFELLLAPYAEHVTGMDLSPEGIDVANRAAQRAGISNVTFLCQSSADLPSGVAFDGVICLAFLHHVPEPMLPTMLGQAFGLIKPGGFFYSQDPNIHGILRKIGRVVLGKRYDVYHTPDERELDPRHIAALLDQVGFANVQLRYIDLTVIPMSYLMRSLPGWPMYPFAAVDELWCRSPVARWATGFAAFARRPV